MDSLGLCWGLSCCRARKNISSMCIAFNSSVTVRPCPTHDAHGSTPGSSPIISSFILGTMMRVKPATVEQVRELHKQWTDHNHTLIHLDLAKNGKLSGANDPDGKKRLEDRKKCADKLVTLVKKDIPGFQLRWGYEGMCDAVRIITRPRFEVVDKNDPEQPDVPIWCQKCGAWERPVPFTSDETPIYCENCELYEKSTTIWQNHMKAMASNPQVAPESHDHPPTSYTRQPNLQDAPESVDRSQYGCRIPTPDAALKDEMKRAFVAAVKTTNAIASTEEPTISRIQTRSRSRSRPHK